MTTSGVPRILIADDDCDLAELLAARCAARGLQAVCVHNAVAALQELTTQTPDIACLDVDMPAGGGLCVCEMMGNEPRWRSVPVIVLTGSRAPETVRRCHDLLAYYVVKGGDVWPRIEPLLEELLGPRLTQPCSPSKLCAATLAVEA